MSKMTLPSLPYAKWVDTRDILHLFLQIVGKIRLKAHPKLNHWWHVTLYPSVRGLTTGRIPYGDASFEISYDMLDHIVNLPCNDGQGVSIKVDKLSVAEFYREIMQGLTALGINVQIHPVPYEDKSKTRRPRGPKLRQAGRSSERAVAVSRKSLPESRRNGRVAARRIQTGISGHLN